MGCVLMDEGRVGWLCAKYVSSYGLSADTVEGRFRASYILLCVYGHM